MEEPLGSKSSEVFSLSNKTALDEYNEKEKDKAINLFKLIIIFLSVINAICVVFYITYTFQIKSLDSYINSISNDISDKERSLKLSRSSFDRLLVKLYFDIKTDLFHLSDLIQTPEEYEMIMNWLPRIDDDHSQLFFCYKSFADGLEPATFRERCSFNGNVLVIIRTSDNKRFGGFAQFLWNTMNDDTLVADINAFLFSIDDKEKYKVIDSNNAFKLLSKGFFMFGLEDLVVEESYENSLRGYTKFPKSYEGSKRLLDEEYFTIDQLEIFNYI